MNKSKTIGLHTNKGKTKNIVMLKRPANLYYLFTLIDLGLFLTATAYLKNV